MNLRTILDAAVAAKASDIHITVGVPVVLRVNGMLKALDDTRLMPEISEQLIRDLTTERQWQQLNSKGEADFSYSLPGVQRFRVNAYRQRNSYAAALRLINNHIPTLDKLGIPPVVEDLTEKNSGIVLEIGRAHV